MAAAPTASLTGAIRQHRLLDTKQLDELSCLQVHFPEAKAFAINLIRRGWLTEYQARRLLQGRGHELILGSYILLDRRGN